MCQCGGGAEHQHGYVAETPILCSLHAYMDLEHIQLLNAKRPSPALQVIRETFQAASEAAIVSDADPQLLIKIPFTGLVKIKSILLHTASDSSSPAELRAFINQPDMDFGAAESKTPTQQWSMVQPASLASGEPIEYTTKAFKFANVSHLTLYVPGNFGASATRISYIGVFGEFSLARTRPIITKYELVPNPSDHKREELLGTTASKSAL